VTWTKAAAECFQRPADLAGFDGPALAPRGRFL
jgi:hypothetical protein